MAIASSGHGQGSSDHRGTVVEAIVHDDAVLLVVCWADGRLSVVPASACVVSSS